MEIPLHIPRNDDSPSANARRHELHIHMASLNPKGWRTIGKRAGVTKPERKNRLTEIALRSYTSIAEEA